MGYRDSDDSSFSRHGMGRDTDDVRYGERGRYAQHEPAGRPGYDGAPEPRTGYRPELDERTDRYGQYGMQRGHDDGVDSRGRYSAQRHEQGAPYRASGQAHYAPNDRSGGYGGGYSEREEQGMRHNGGRWDHPQDRFGDSSYQDQGDGGAYGFLRNSPGGRHGSSHGARDHDYQKWRDEALRLLDEDYDAWRKERYQKFSDDFNQWRSNRAGGAGSTVAQQASGAKAHPGAGSASASVTGGTSSASSSKGKEPLG